MWGLPCWRRRWTSEEREEGKPSLAPPPPSSFLTLSAFFFPLPLSCCVFSLLNSLFSFFQQAVFLFRGGRETEREAEREREREGEGGRERRRGRERECACVRVCRESTCAGSNEENRREGLGFEVASRRRTSTAGRKKKRSSRRRSQSRSRLQARHTSLDARLSTLENPRSPASKLRAFTLQEQPLVCLSNALSPNNAFRHRSPRCRCPGCGFRHAISPSRFHRGEPFRRRAPIRRRFGREKGLEEILRREQQRKQQQQL